MKAVLIVRDRVTLPDDALVHVVVWRVPMDTKHPEGVRYRMAFIPRGHERPAVLYDNHFPKGHHKHIEGREFPYAYIDLLRLTADFEKDILEWQTARGTLS